MDSDFVAFYLMDILLGIFYVWLVWAYVRSVDSLLKPERSSVAFSIRDGIVTLASCLCLTGEEVVPEKFSPCFYG